MKQYKISLNFPGSTVTHLLGKKNHFTVKDSSYGAQEKMALKKTNVAGQRCPLCKWELSYSPLSSSVVFLCCIKVMKQPYDTEKTQVCVYASNLFLAAACQYLFKYFSALVNPERHFSALQERGCVICQLNGYRDGISAPEPFYCKPMTEK